VTRDDRRRLVYDIVRRHNRGESQRQIARAKGIARKTVSKILNEHERRRAEGDDALERELVRPRAPRPSKLDPYVDQIDAILEEFPDATAVRIKEIITDAGFDGGYSIVRDHVSKVRPRAKRRAYDPVHTEPGQQAQCDWSPYTLAGCRVDVQAFSLVLHYSSWQYVDFQPDKPQPRLLSCLKAGLEDFQGVPAEIVFDSEKTVVDRWEMGRPIINARFADFAAYYGFAVHIAPRADGAYKGGVERPFRTLEERFLNARKFADLLSARARLAQWRDEFAEETHRTKRQTRLAMLEQERPKLRPLPRRPYDTSLVVARIADGFHRIVFETNTYTVPRDYVGHRLFVRVSEDLVRVYDPAIRLIAQHERVSAGSGEDRELPEHRRQRRIDIDKVLERFDGWGEAAGTFARQLRQHKRYAGQELSSIVLFQADYALEDILAAIEHATRYQAYDARALKRILEVHAEPLTRQDVVAERIRTGIRRTLDKVPVRQRQLSVYQRVLSARQDEPSTQETDDELAHKDPDKNDAG